MANACRVLKDETTEIQPGDPTPEEIERLCDEIQLKGFTGGDGVYRPPWSDETRLARRQHNPADGGRRSRNPEPEPFTIPFVRIRDLIETDDDSYD